MFGVKYVSSISTALHLIVKTLALLKAVIYLTLSESFRDLQLNMLLPKGTYILG